MPYVIISVEGDGSTVSQGEFLITAVNLFFIAANAISHRWMHGVMEYWL